MMLGLWVISLKFSFIIESYYQRTHLIIISLTEINDLKTYLVQTRDKHPDYLSV